MKFKLLIITIMFATVLPCVAQSEIKIPGTLKSTVMVDYFNAGMAVRDRDLGYVEYLRNKIISGLRYSKRVKIYDVDDNMELRAYDTRNQGSIESMRKRYSTMLDLDVDYVIECDVREISAVSSKTIEGSWVGLTAYTIRLVNPETGNVVTRFKYETSDSKYTAKDPDVAIKSSLDYITSRMNVFILDNFRIEGQIVDVVSTKKEEVKEVTLNVGPVNAASKGSKFEVHKVVNGKAGAKIGEVKITEVTGDESSIAKVVKGGKDVTKAINEGELLMIVSDKSSFWDHF